MCNHIADVTELLCSLLRLVICTLLRVLYLRPCKTGLKALPCSVTCSREGDQFRPIRDTEIFDFCIKKRAQTYRVLSEPRDTDTHSLLKNNVLSHMR